MKLQWIDVKDAQPKHSELVLARSERNTIAVVIFTDNEEVFKALMMRNIQIPPEERKGFSFCSQEIAGNAFNNVTHWAYIPKVNTK
jgi:hypothetical protein